MSAAEEKKIINLPSYDALIIVKDGIMKEIEGPPTGFGKQTITWQNGKPTHIDTQFTRKI